MDSIGWADLLGYRPAAVVNASAMESPHELQAHRPGDIGHRRVEVHAPNARIDRVIRIGIFLYRTM